MARQFASLASRCTVVLVLLLLCGCNLFRTSRAPGNPDADGRAVTASSETSSSSSASSTVGVDGFIRTSQAFPTGDRATSALLVEKISPRQIRLNQPYHYEIRATNLTDGPLLDVVVRERLADREVFEITESEPRFRTEGEWTHYPLGQIAAGESQTIRVTGMPWREGTISSVIAADYKPGMKTVAEVVNPILRLTKEAPESADLCEGIRYRYVVSNVGTGAERDVVIEDVLPEGLTTSDGLRTVRIQVGDVPAGREREFEIRVKPDKAGTFSSAAVARVPGGAEVRSQSVSTSVHQPTLDVAITGPATEYLNKTAAYQVTIKNVGQVRAARGALAIDTGGRGALASIRSTRGGGGNRPADGPKADAPAEPRMAGGAGRDSDARPIAAADSRAEGYSLDPIVAARQEGAELGTLAPGESRTFTVAVVPSREGELTVSAIGLASCVTPVKAVARTDVRALAELKVDVSDLDDPIRIGEDVTYRIVVRNTGTGSDRNIAVTATLPSGTQFVDATGATQAKVSGQDVDFGVLSSLAPAMEATWTVRARANSPGDVRMEVRVKSESLKQEAVEAEPTKLY